MDITGLEPINPTRINLITRGIPHFKPLLRGTASTTILVSSVISLEVTHINYLCLCAYPKWTLQDLNLRPIA